MDKFNATNYIIELKGKKYLPVAPRVMWFREEKPDWEIKTVLETHDPQLKLAVFKCEISNPEGKLVSTGYGSETLSDFKDYLEKAETKAVGRALAFLGYGTLFALHEDEEMIVDAPQAEKQQLVTCDECGESFPRVIAISIYKKYGRKLCPTCAAKMPPQ